MCCCFFFFFQLLLACKQVQHVTLRYDVVHAQRSNVKRLPGTALFTWKCEGKVRESLVVLDGGLVSHQGGIVH